jgi:hypothetical protein
VIRVGGRDVIWVGGACGPRRQSLLRSFLAARIECRDLSLRGRGCLPLRYSPSSAGMFGPHYDEASTVIYRGVNQVLNGQDAGRVLGDVQVQLERLLGN